MTEPSSVANPFTIEKVIPSPTSKELVVLVTIDRDHSPLTLQAFRPNHITKAAAIAFVVASLGAAVDPSLVPVAEFIGVTTILIWFTA